MDQELKDYLDTKFTDVSAKFADVRNDMETGFRDVRGEMETGFKEVRNEMETGFRDVRAEIEATETRLLTEFWKWGRASDQRVRRLEHSDSTTAERLAAMEERIFTLERKAAGGKS